jgi:ribosomal protein S18 acetylase RimI-like enzyme
MHKSTQPFRIRRGRRTDFTAVVSLLAAAGLPVPPPDRATLRRFRNIVADLGADFYLVLVDETVAIRPARAVLELLVVAEGFRRRGAGTALLALARDRARRRGCSALWCVVGETDASARRFLEKAGFTRHGDWLVDARHGAGDRLTGPGRG